MLWKFTLSLSTLCMLRKKIMLNKKPWNINKWNKSNLFCGYFIIYLKVLKTTLLSVSCIYARIIIKTSFVWYTKNYTSKVKCISVFANNIITINLEISNIQIPIKLISRTKHESILSNSFFIWYIRKCVYYFLCVFKSVSVAVFC